MQQKLALLLLTWLVSACKTMSQAPEVEFIEVKPLAIAATKQSVPPASGSLYHPSRHRGAFEDWRARRVGDLVTIQIVENVTASQKSTSTLNRASSTSAGVDAFPLISAAAKAKLKIGLESANDFSGKGGTESANTFAGSITASVVEVLANGHLVVAGDKQIGVNQNVDVLRFSGVIDPRSIQAGGWVSSNQVAHVRVQSKGRGAQDEAQTIGWLSRFFLSFLPF